MLKFAFAALILAAPQVYAAPTIESLRGSGARLQNRLQTSIFSRLAEETERDRNVKLTRLARDKAYRVSSELQMLENTALEVQQELAALAANPRDQARSDRVEFLLKFILDAWPPQADQLSWTMSWIIHLKYGLPDAGDAGYIAAIREMDGRIIEADESGKKLKAAVDAIRSRAHGSAGPTQRVQWLSGRLADYGEDYAGYSAHVREESAKLIGRLPGQS